MKIAIILYSFLYQLICKAKKNAILNNNTYKLVIGENFKFDFIRNNFEIQQNCEVQIKDNVIFRDYCNIMVYNNGKLILGEYVFFNRYSSINCLNNINIGDYTIFGEGVKLYDHNHQFANLDSIIQNEPCKVGKISIGRNCWLGANVTILNNVTIGDNVIVGANNLIYKDIPSNVIIKDKVEYLVQTRS